MSLGLLLIILNYYSHSLLGKKEYDIKLSHALRSFATSIYKSRDFMWENMRFCQVVHSIQRELKYSQVPHQR